MKRKEPRENMRRKKEAAEMRNQRMDKKLAKMMRNEKRGGGSGLLRYSSP